MQPAARATQALAHWGVRARRLRCVSCSHAEVWRVLAESPALELALRIYPEEPGGAEALDGELALLRDAGASGLPVPRPLPTPDGRWRVPLDGGRQAVLLTWLQGRLLWAGLRPLHLRQLGVFIARLHGVSSALVAQGREPSRAAWGPDLDALSSGPDRLHQWGGAALQRAVAQAASEVRAEMTGWPRDLAHWGWIHGDLHPWNLLFRQGQAGAIDFSDGGWGFLAQDLASALQFIRHPLDDGVDHRPQAPAFEAALLDGYASVSPLPPQTQRQLPALHRLRMLSTLQWMLSDWRGPDDCAWGPAYLRALPGRLNDRDR